MNRWKFRIGILLVFLVGIVIGAVGAGWWFTSPFRDFHGPPERVQTRLMDRLTHYLDLTEEQRRDVRPILRDIYSQFRAIRDRVGPDVEQTFQQGLVRLKPMLTEKQYEKLEKRYEQTLRRWHRRDSD